MQQIWAQVMEGLQESELLTLVAQYAQEARERDQYIAGLINLYETELKKLSLSTDNLLNDKQKQVLQEEIHHLTSPSVENFRHGDIASWHDLITGDLINDFVSNIQDHCPLIPLQAPTRGSQNSPPP